MAKDRRMKTEVVKINPTLALEMLGDNEHNRKVTQSRVNEYASEMKNGMWLLNGETIIMSETGKLLDGQHRLLGLIPHLLPRR